MIRSMMRRGLVMSLVLVVAWLVKVTLKWTTILTYRYCTGHPMVGESTTDATFWSRGTQMVGRPNTWGRRTASRWSLMPMWQRAIWRLAVPATAAGTFYLWSRWPDTTRWTVATLGGAVLGYAAWYVYSRLRLENHMARFVRPLHQVLTTELGIDDDGLRPQDWLHVPTNFHEATARIRIDLPPRFYAGAVDDEDDPMAARRGGGESRGRRLVDGVVTEKLGLRSSEVTSAYRMVGAKPVVEFRHIAPVPTSVTVDDVRDELAKTPESKVVLALGRGGRPIKIDLDSESPHVVFSIGTGGGKSYVLRGIAAPLLAHGAHAIICDLKRHSQRIFRSHPNVRYLRDPQDIHAEFLALADELDRRNVLIDEDGEDADVGPRLAVVVEEINGLRDALADYWMSIKSSGDPARSPAVRALNRLLYMGRAARCHVVTTAQMATAEALGGPAARENYGARILGRATPQNWAMLAGDIPRSAIPKKTKRPGHMHLVFAGDVIEMQAVFWNDDDVRKWAWSCFEQGTETTVSQLSQTDFYQGRHHVTVSQGAVTDTAQIHESAKAQEVENTNAQIDNGGQIRTPDRHLFSVPSNGSPEMVEADEGIPAEESEVSAAAAAETDPAEECIGLRTAVSRGVVMADRDPKKAVLSLRAARQRDPEFPSAVEVRGKEKLYRVGDLQRWERNRPRGEAG